VGKFSEQTGTNWPVVIFLAVILIVLGLLFIPKMMASSPTDQPAAVETAAPAPAQASPVKADKPSEKDAASSGKPALNLHTD
jgi:hypothetical protein